MATSFYNAGFVPCMVKIWVSCNPRNPANENTSRQGPGNLVSKKLVGRCVMELKKAMNERITWKGWYGNKHKKNWKKSVKEQLQSSLMNNSYIELSLLLVHGHGTMSWVSGLLHLVCVFIIFISLYSCHTCSDDMGGYNTEARILVLV